MRRAGARLAAEIAEPMPLLERLERHRDHHFRRIPARRVTGEKSALAFINDVGFCSAFTAGLGVPCLREAICGEREPQLPEHIQHDYAIGMTWRIKDTLPARRALYYGKVIAGRPGFIARDMVGAFLKLRAVAGGYQRLYRRGHLSHCAKLVMDTLVKRGPSETRVLKLSSGYSQPSRRAVFDRAMKELQEKFLALKVEEHYEPFSYVWDTVEHRWADAIAEARSMTTSEAARRIVRRYFEIAAFGDCRSIARTLGIERAVVERACRELERAGLVVSGVRCDSVPGAVIVLREFV